VLAELISDYTLRTVALGSTVLGAVAGTIGVFAVLRRQSLLGDAISHAALPGIALAFMLTGSKETLVLVLGAALAGWVATLFVLGVVRGSRVPEDSALGIALSVFFGAGLVLLTFLQNRPSAAQAGLDKFLFGQAATLLERDVAVIAALGAIVIASVMLCWKELKLLAFDREFGASLGLPMARVEIVLTTLLVLAIVIGLQTVGVVLMSALVVAPAVAARQWTDRLGGMVALAALFGAIAGTTGALASSRVERLPTGPTTVLAVTALVAVSVGFAPRRGLVWSAVRRRANRRRLRGDTVLRDLYALARHHEDPDHGHAAAVLEAMGPGKGGVDRSLALLAEQGWVRQGADGTWRLTPSGRLRAEALANPEDGGEP
jgi:manganese/zinc/iron transport system permease protein